MKKIRPARAVIYVIGLLILALGQALNTKTGLGVSPLTSVPYTLSLITGVSFGNASFVAHIVFVAIQLVLREKKQWPSIVLQLGVSLLFTRVLDLYGLLLSFTCTAIWQRLIVLAAGITCIGVGTSMALAMRLWPNPPDGFVQTLADKMHKEVGFAKNMADLANAVLAVIIGFFFGNAFMGVGAGTVIGVLCIGRVMFLLNKAFKARMLKAAGLEG